MISRRKEERRVAWWPALGVLLLAALSGCGKHGKAAPVGGSDLPPAKVKLQRNVELTSAEQRSLIYYVDTVGYLEAERQTDIAAGVTGLVDEVLFREGQWVDQDTVLVTVDQRRYQIAVDDKKAMEKRAEANLAFAVDKVKRDGRSGPDVVSEEDRNRDYMAQQMAQAELNSTRAQRVQAEHNLQLSQVRAPYAGQMNSRKVTPGTYLEEKTIIGSIADLSRLRLVGYVPEKAAPVARDILNQQTRAQAPGLLSALFAGPSPLFAVAAVAGQLNLPAQNSFGIEFTLQPYPKKVFQGRIFFLSTVASPDTHMFECKAEVDNADPTLELRPGFTAQIRIPLQGKPDACVVPEEAIRASEKGFIAFVPEKNTQGEWIARERPIELGYRSPGWVEVLRGMRPGECLVRKGAEALENNTPIAFPDEQLKLVNQPTTLAK
jgi:multidrug efflux system membrane fusion protein